MKKRSNLWLFVSRVLWLFMLVLLTPSANAYDEEEYRPEEEGGLPFNVPENGLWFPRTIYDANGDDVTRVPYFPTGQNDTAFIKREKFQILRWQQDSPNFVIIFVEDSTPYHYELAEVDLRVRIGHQDRLGNMIEAARVERYKIPIKKGLTRIQINVPNLKGDIVHANLIGVRTKQNYQPIELGD